MRRHFETPLLALLLAAPVTALAQGKVDSGQRVLTTNRRIEIWVASGNVTLHHGTGNAAAITGTAQGADGGQLRFETDDESGNLRYRVIFPDVDNIASPDGSRGSTELNLRPDGTFGDNGNWARRRGNRTRIGGSGGFRGFAVIEVAVPDGKNVVVHVGHGKASADGVNGNVTLDTYGGDAEATNISGDWLLDTGSGAAVVRGMRAGSLKLDTGSGAATVSDIVADMLDLDTGSGDAEATNVRVARFKFDTGSGDVHATGLTSPRGVIDTGSGRADVAYTGGTIDDLSVDTGSGRVNLTLPPNVDARVTIETGGGSLNIERAGALMERRSDDATIIRFGEGRGRIKIDTGSGGVTIR